MALAKPQLIYGLASIITDEAVCCGVSSYTDWDDMINWNKTYPGITDSAKLPLSCCKIKRDSRTKEFKGILFGDFINSSDCLSSRETGTYNTVSCYDRLRTFILNNKVIIIATFVIVILVQVSIRLPFFSLFGLL
ncbi:hypothetical protein LSH36_2097g00001 [Paralvinella palmiformis]|uniref:Tetraspanin n=1 Tax=Paralvinella palmiformis TaxID=53620 RepID=A0AAD9MM73_9ANNE|nr:hypothetical protein LSH36_2097g00001 [Paralvinella palmiformis]